MGGLRASGRWHHAGRQIVYLAENPPGALLEVCVHTASNDLPTDFTLLQVEGPNTAVPLIDIDNFPVDWTTNLIVTRGIGDKWIAGATSVLLRVPSVIVPRTFNYLFNPSHSLAREFSITQKFTYPFDVRIKS